MKNKKNEKTLKFTKTKVLKFYQIETLFGGLANSGCTCPTEKPVKVAPRQPQG
ncbi:hypothetical protein IMCC3317_07620 [Kordia antarctica]|uniref:Uncharacterized protein n=1 Tax=Kordia antarctica TaxID=1218801 RepID=A0A7L4ZGN8_9FLAO|nr:hypothetical protein [Kordia antarctica]QHI35416.1 hypothetical protein IMCC3317_07620 [Kordia antarctica]